MTDRKMLNDILKSASGKRIVYFLFFPLAIFYIELIVKIACFDRISLSSFLYTGLFSISLGLGCAFLSSIARRSINRWISAILIAVIWLFCAAQILYFTIFNTFGTLYSLFAGADAITEYWQATAGGIKASAFPLLLSALPLVLLLILGRGYVPEKRMDKKHLFRLAGSSFGAYLLAVLLIYANSSGVMPVKYLYGKSFVPALSVDLFGVTTTLRLDAKNLLLGGLTVHNPGPSPDPDDPSKEAAPPEYGYNVTDIDFDALIAGEKNEAIKDMHIYFSSVTPTKKNEYTGMFAGKNLIWIVGEAFSSLALNEETSPTLCRMAREGFVFSNFYNPVWSVSTSDGEYVTLTGLIPKSGVWSFKESSKNYMPYCFGNLLSPLGYTCKAYHNHYYKYYGRNLSHPNMGYDYKGLGNGLNVKETWPESDLEMMELTLPKDMNAAPFHNYYMTVSGHLNYTFYGNYMAAKHKDKVDHMGYSEAGKAYLACNAEFDLAVKYLQEELSRAGLLEDTVIVISGDHYPYGLTDDEMDELAGHTLEKRFEKYKSTLIIWCGSMKEPISVDKVCSSLDIMPTLANLLGLNYDSRLVMGKDILSDSPGLVEFNDRSFITDLGRYNAKTNVFVPNAGITVEEGYAKGVLSVVNKEFSYSAKILEKNYYKKVLN